MECFEAGFDRDLYVIATGMAAVCGFERPFKEDAAKLLTSVTMNAG